MTGLPPFNAPPPLYNNLRGSNNEASTSTDIAAPPSYEEAINPNGVIKILNISYIMFYILF